MRAIVCVYKVGSVDEEGSPWTIRDEQIVWMRSTDGGLTWVEAEKLIYEDRSTRQENCCGTGYLSDSGVFMHPFYVLNPDYEERAKQENWSKLRLAVRRATSGNREQRGSPAPTLTRPPAVPRGPPRG